MRYIVTTPTGEHFATDFDAAIPIRNPEGHSIGVGNAYWCKHATNVSRGSSCPRWETYGVVHGRSFGHDNNGIVGVLDTDCG